MRNSGRSKRTTRRSAETDRGEALSGACQKLGSRLQVTKRETELTALPAPVSAVLLRAGARLSALWFGRVA